MAQIVAADLILLNKIDLLSAEEVQNVQKRVEEWNPLASLVRTKYAELSVDSILELSGSALDRLLSSDPGVLSIHDKDIVTVAATSRSPVYVSEVVGRLESLLADPTKSVLRLKGILYEANGKTTVVQGVQSILSVSSVETPSEALADGQPDDPLSVVVAIGYNLKQTAFDDLLVHSTSRRVEE